MGCLACQCVQIRHEVPRFVRVATNVPLQGLACNDFFKAEDHHSLHKQANENASPHAQLLPGSWELHPKPLSAHFFGSHCSTVNGQMHEPALA